MSDQGDQGNEGDQRGPRAVETEWQRKRRLAEVFGDVLPQSTGDDRDEPSSDDERESASERWLKSQVPPHHGG